MTDVETWIRSNVPADRDLDRAELARLATDLGRRPDLWEPYVNHDTSIRFYRQLHRDPHLDIWLQCWIDGQETGYHDHDLSHGAVCVVGGTLLKDGFQRDADGWIRERTVERHVGSVFDFDPTYIHGLRHPRTPEPTTSIHCYSPALWRMGHYEPDATGMMRRLSVTYADELVA